MASTVRIASTLPMALRIQEPNPNPEKPGLAPPLRSAALNGANTPGSGGTGVTTVDADLWKAFSKSEDFAGYAEHLREIGDDEDLGASQFGFEPGLQALADDKDNTKLAKQGSTLTEGGAVSAADMKPTSDTPSDDSPRSQPTVTAPVSPSAAASAGAAPAGSGHAAKAKINR